ncbi:PTS system mannose/fructose/sorbose family transporter subunit IID [Enterococcus sp. AZ103]|uniref:PTS system mannose/fructose/sorbose family transporter subunit IID n=1 Tax=Enterococcus sp. AZ103 TaxID=2774628 RepID=UPI003F1F7C52
MTSKNELTKEDKKMIHSIFWRSFPLYAQYSYAKNGGAGFAYALMPAINRFYKKAEDKKEALYRNIVWFNTTGNFSSFIMGLAASMEKENSEKPDFDESSINAVKSSLMGPMAGIGDSIFWGVLRIIAAGVAVGLGNEGNILAPLVFLLIYNIPSIITRYYGTFLGYTLGSKYIEKIYSSGVIHIMTKAASTLGLIMVGGMTSNIVTFTAKLQWSAGSDTMFKLQDILDQILVGMVPLGVTLLCFYLMNKKVSFNLVLVGIVAFGIILSVLGIA